MQSLSRSLAAGLQMDHSWKDGKSSFSGALRYQPTKGHVFTAGFVPIQAGMQLGQFTYARTFQTSPNEAVTMSTALQATSTGETTCTAALDMQLNESTLQLTVDNRLSAQWSYTERLAGDLFSLTLNGSMSHAEQAYKFGFGISCNL
jgi:hypothetical protein